VHRKKTIDRTPLLTYRNTNNYSDSEEMSSNREKGPRISEELVQGFRVLQAFTAANPTLSLTQVAIRAGVDSGTAFHLIQTLMVLGYVERIARSKQFRLTLKPLELGFNAIAPNSQSSPSRGGIDNGTKGPNSCSVSETTTNYYSLSEFRRNLK
jgi:IclR helix-turn-helix domain